MQGFIQFIREQGVIGLAIGFILGAAVSKVVASLVDRVHRAVSPTPANHYFSNRVRGNSYVQALEKGYVVRIVHMYVLNGFTQRK